MVLYGELIRLCHCMIRINVEECLVALAVNCLIIIVLITLKVISWGIETLYFAMH